MTTYILKRKFFADLDYNEFSKFLETVKGYKKGDDGRFAEWNTYKNDQELIKEYETWKVKADEAKAKAKELLKKENEKIRENSLYNRGKRYAAEVWNNHKKAIKIGSGAVAVGGVGAGIYEYAKKRSSDKDKQKSNDKIRKQIVG